MHVNGIEFPVVKVGQARLRVCLLPQHTQAHLDKFFDVFDESLAKASEIFETSMEKFSEEMSKQENAKL